MAQTISGPGSGMTRRTVLLAGATGLVGQALMHGLLADPSVGLVVALGRRPVVLAHPRLRPLVVDFTAIPALPPAEEAYLALGTTIAVAGSQAAFRAVDFDANLAVARAARQAGVRRLGLVSAMGADPHSGIFYNRVKGELEKALETLGFDGLVIARPSLLLGDREALGQPSRRIEGLAARLTGGVRRMIPANYRPIAAADVARALLTRVPLATHRELLLSGAMQPPD